MAPSRLVPSGLLEMKRTRFISTYLSDTFRVEVVRVAGRYGAKLKLYQ
jgi:hypothetical protein